VKPFAAAGLSRRAALPMLSTMPDRTEGAPIVSTISKGVAGAARAPAAVTANLARHAIWYVRYRVEGNSRAQSKRDQRSR
jgi:hypothetical protein